MRWRATVPLLAGLGVATGSAAAQPRTPGVVASPRPRRQTVDGGSSALPPPSAAPGAELSPTRPRGPDGVTAADGSSADASAVADRAAALRAVVRLRGPRGLVCTATVVRVGRRVGVLTAAHCLFESDALGALLDPRQGLTAEGVGALDPTRAVVERGFRMCTEQRVPWRECISRQAQDVAWVPLDVVPDAIVPWSVCPDRVAPRDVTIFGYGLNGRALPRVLLRGAFRVDAPTSRRLRSATGVSVAVDAGDSGGPVIRSSDDEGLARRVPCVHYVAVAVQVAAGSERVPESTALLEPVRGARALPTPE